MYSVQAQPDSRLLHTGETAVGRAPASHRLRTLFGVLRGHRRTRGDAIPQYEGRAWCDSTEQQVITGIVTCRTAI